ncbi:NAD(P)/FAD-dependent oxidoreductase [Patescibacteria group bacterium]|nr:NAD(P)/FAD-dependent oxidoreductase [Patescibacteria group bacterium]MBU1672845.1 NAD(P)/FAD-dependent oxidoreductase [Patescibacteria group bacterium]MBU1963734.1 NAD(P)/FAD-dependent oxidoreductase [Patescibacteria group bacterium]
MKAYDIIIIGAGPGGLNCARHLMASGKSVLLLEQKPEIGPKVCAGGLTLKDIEYLKIPKKTLDFAANKVVVHTPSKSVTAEEKNNFIFTVDRGRLGQWMLSQLKNIEVRTNAQVTEIKKESVILNKKEEIGFDYLIGADGASSITRNYLGLESKKLLMGIQYLVPKKYNALELFFNTKSFHSGYAWIFPHKEFDSIGCACDIRYMQPKVLRENFSTWLKEKKIDVSKGKYQSHLINYDYQGYKFDNVFLIGAAGGFTSGFTGEGMYPAMLTGQETARMILDKDYKSEKIEELLEIKQHQERDMKIFEKSGIIRRLIPNFLLLLLKNKKIQDKMISRYA